MKPNEIPSWAIQQSADLVTFAGVPRQYRFDGEMGSFVIGELDYGPTLQMQIFDRRFVTGERWGRPNQTWLDLAFVDEAGVVSVIALKKESASNVIEAFLTELRITTHSTLDPMAVDLVLESERREAEDGPYWVAEVRGWSLVPQERFEAVKRFAESGQFRWVFLGEAGV